MVTDSAVLESEPRRRLTTVMAADICGYSRLAEINEAAAVKTVEIVFAAFEKIVTQHHGRVFNRAGDGFFAEFPSAADGANAAVAFIDDIKARDTLSPNAPNAQVRVGVHVGDVVDQPNGDLLGHGVNIAARLQSEAEPNGVLISLHAVNLVRDKVDAQFRRRGPMALKNIDEPVVAFDISSSKNKTFLHKITLIASKIRALPKAYSIIFAFSISALLLNYLIAGNVIKKIADLNSETSPESYEEHTFTTAQEILRHKTRSKSEEDFHTNILNRLRLSDEKAKRDAFTLLTNRDYHAALKKLTVDYEDKKPSLSQNETISYLHLLGALSIDRRPDKAKDAYQEILKNNSEDFIAHVRLGEICYYQSNYDCANQSFSKALQIGVATSRSGIICKH